MPKVTSCSVEASKVVLPSSRFQNLGLRSHFWGVCRFSFWRIPHIPWFLLNFAVLPACLPPQCQGIPKTGGVSRWLGCLCPSPSVAIVVPAPLLTHRCQQSPHSTGCWAPSCTARACRPGRAKRGRRAGLEPLHTETPPSPCPVASSGALLTGTKLSLRRRTMSPTQMSRHFCWRKLQEN